jgi:L-ascorbate metabolism protein UlaG (beta-lactamase superfamily)
MEITALGFDSFRITGKQLDIVVNPFDSAKLGLKAPSLSPNLILLSSEQPHRAEVEHSAEQIVIDRPGEYELRGTTVEGIDLGGGVTAYQIAIDGLTVGYLGEIPAETPTAKLQDLTDTDIIFVPVGGELGAKKAAELISKLEPKVIIPTHFATPGVKVEAEPVDAFLKEMGSKATPESKFKVTTKDLPEEPTVVLLQP